MTITALPASIDLTGSKTANVVVTNTSSTTENVTLNNSVSGLEWSEDGGINWNTGNDSFDIYHKLISNSDYYMDSSGNLTTTISAYFIGTTDANGDLTVAIGDVDYLLINNTDNLLINNTNKLITGV